MAKLRNAPRLLTVLQAVVVIAGLPQAARSDDAGNPVTIKVGDPAVDATIFRPYKNEFKIHQFSATGESLKDWGKSTDEFQKLELNGKPVFKRTQVTTTPKKTITETVVFDAQTLTPIETDETDTAGVYQHYEFAGGTVKVERSTDPPGAERQRSEIKLDMPVFDFSGGLYGLLVAALPLREGMTFRLPIFQEEPPEGTSWQTFKVTGKETVADSRGGKHEAWVAETQIGTFRVVFYLTKEAPYLVRLVNHGPRGGQQVFEMM